MKSLLSTTAILALAISTTGISIAAEANLTGTWRIGNAGTQSFLRGSKTSKQLVSTLSFKNDDYATFVLQRLPSGAYTVHCKGNGKPLQVDVTGDRILSTRDHVDRDHAVFAFDRQADNTFRIRVKASRRFLHNDRTSGLISTLNQADTPFSRFVLFQPQSTPQNMVVVDIAALPRPVLAGAPAGSIPGAAGPPGSTGAPTPAIASTPMPSLPATPPGTIAPTPPATVATTIPPSMPAPPTPGGGSSNPFLPKSPFGSNTNTPSTPSTPTAPVGTNAPGPLAPVGPPPTTTSTTPFPGAASLPGVIPPGRDRPIHPFAVYDVLRAPEDGTQPVYTQIPLDIIYDLYPYADVVIERDWVVLRSPQDGDELGYKFERDEGGIYYFGIPGENEDDPNTIVAAQIVSKPIRLNGADTVIEVLDILGLASDDPAVDLGPPANTDPRGRPLHPVVLNAFVPIADHLPAPEIAQKPMDTVYSKGPSHPDRNLTTEGGRVTYREADDNYTTYTTRDLGNGVTRYNLEMRDPSSGIVRAAIDARITTRNFTYSDKAYPIQVFDLVGASTVDGATAPGTTAAPAPYPAPSPAALAPTTTSPVPTTPPVPTPNAPAAPKVAPTLPAITPVTSRVRPSEKVKMITYANIARSKHGLSPLAWSDEIAAYAQGVADHLAGIFANEREALQFKNRLQSREGADFPLDYGPPNPEPGLPPHSAFFYDRRPTSPDKNLPPYGILIEVHPKDYATPPSKSLNSYPERYQWNPERVITPSSPGAPLTQLIWKDTRHLGCGVAEKADYHLTVFCFDPAGNVIGRTPY